MLDGDGRIKVGQSTNDTKGSQGRGLGIFLRRNSFQFNLEVACLCTDLNFVGISGSVRIGAQFYLGFVKPQSGQGNGSRYIGVFWIV